ncbi:MAG: Do family serine endopeptidase [Spirochaetia bacterium]
MKMRSATPRKAALLATVLLLAVPTFVSAQVPGALQSMQTAFRAVAQKVLPVVVEIDVTEVIKQRLPQLELPFDWFFGQPQPNGGERSFRQSGLGSGIIVRRAGNVIYVLTNNHVVKDATDISVKTNDGRIFKAKVVGTDPRKDVALVSFQTGDDVGIAELGDSNTLEVGDIVFAVGNPLGFTSSVTMGIVSAIGRRAPTSDVATYTDYVQTDAPINQGNSGGALVNIRGQVIGMNTWIAAPSGGNVGLGFAIPINNARQAIDDFISKGRVEYGWLGVQIGDIQDSGPSLAIAKDLKVDGTKGAFIWNLYRGSPADRAGLLPGDFVTRMNGKVVHDKDELSQVIGSLRAGDSEEFTVMRYGRPLTVRVTIGRRDDQDRVAQSKNLWPGLTAIPITDEVRQDQTIPRGVRGVIVGDMPDQNTPAAVAGIQTADIITSINGRAVRSMMDYYKALNDSARRTVTFGILRNGKDISIGLSP